MRYQENLAKVITALLLTLFLSGCFFNEFVPPSHGGTFKSNLSLKAVDRVGDTLEIAMDIGRQILDPNQYVIVVTTNTPTFGVSPPYTLGGVIQSIVPEIEITEPQMSSERNPVLVPIKSIGFKSVKFKVKLLKTGIVELNIFTLMKTTQSPTGYIATNLARGGVSLQIQPAL